MAMTPGEREQLVARADRALADHATTRVLWLAYEATDREMVNVARELAETLHALVAALSPEGREPSDDGHFGSLSIEMDSMLAGSDNRALAEWLVMHATSIRAALLHAAATRASLSGSPGDEERERLAKWMEHHAAHQDEIAKSTEKYPRGEWPLADHVAVTAPQHAADYRAIAAALRGSRGETT